MGGGGKHDVRLFRLGTGVMGMSNLTFDPDTYCVHWGAKSIRLTKIEFELLRHLVKSQGGFLDRQQLLRNVWGSRISVEIRTVDSHMVRLRRKLSQLGTKGPAIETVWGLGYRVRTAADDPTLSR